MSNCQIKKTHSSWLWSFIFIGVLGSCATPLPIEDKSSRKIIKTWGNIDQRFYLKDESGTPASHFFFDVDPKITNLTAEHATNSPINYVVTTPQGSKVGYDLDLLSGELYRERNYCEKRDIWKSFTGAVETPNFTKGIIPRVLDKKTRPLEVIVIADKSKVEPFNKKPNYFDEVRIVGSLIVQECEFYPCNTNEEWDSKQVLVGVSARDPKNVATMNFTDLKKQVDWKYTKAFIENADGVHLMGTMAHPRYRLVSEYNLKDTYEYLQSNSEIITDEKLEKLKMWRKSCMDFYDDFYKKVELARSDKENGANKFLKIYKDFHTTKGKRFNACTKLVRPANILEDKRRHWFFVQVQAFESLYKSGYYYSCRNNAWLYNPRNSDGSFYVDQAKELARCQGNALEKGFDTIVNALHLLANATNQTYRYVEYDNKTGGSHQFLYTWIYEKTSDPNCIESKSMKAQTNIELFPHDVSWEYFPTGKSSTIR